MFCMKRVGLEVGILNLLRVVLSYLTRWVVEVLAAWFCGRLVFLSVFSVWY